MPGTNSKPAADRNRINVHEDHERRYWSHSLGVLCDELKRK
ncbi:MAG: DUF3606 domain-containing protein [Pseudolabrys sp.]|jgi:hypothetical protein